MPSVSEDAASSRGRIAALAGAGSGAVVDVIYLRAIFDQHTGLDSRVSFVAGFIALMALLALTAALRRDSASLAPRLLLLGASSGFLAIGVVGLWSIGFALIAAGLVTFSGTSPTSLPRVAALAAILSPIIALVAGLALTAY